MLTELRGNDRLITAIITVNAPYWYRAEPKCNFSKSSGIRWMHSMRSTVADFVGFCFWISEGNEILLGN